MRINEYCQKVNNWYWLRFQTLIRLQQPNHAFRCHFEKVPKCYHTISLFFFFFKKELYAMLIIPSSPSRPHRLNVTPAKYTSKACSKEFCHCRMAGSGEGGQTVSARGHPRKQKIVNCFGCQFATLCGEGHSSLLYTGTCGVAHSKSAHGHAVWGWVGHRILHIVHTAQGHMLLQ